MINIKNKPYYLFIFTIIIVGLIYFPGLKGGFLFDDLPNLGDMSRYVGQQKWESAKQYIFGGFSGPTGRPISLATFWIQNSSWIEGDPFPFKLLNLSIHLLCGFLLFTVIIRLLKEYKYSNNNVPWIALIASILWLVHPMFISTTLYVVQRMTQLSFLFILLGILGYLKSKTYILSHRLKAYLGMSFSITIATILATFSKENGALLPLFILVIEFCNPNKNNTFLWQWKVLFLWIPSIAVSYLILREINFSEKLWPNRNFNQPERLMTETRILTDYLFRLYIPQIENFGLYQDGYKVSKSFTQPISTLYSTVFLGMLFASAIVCRHRFPLFSLGILIFFAAHLMESTFLGLELYFEHRNYSAAMFIFLPLAAGLVSLSNHIKPKIVVILVCSIVGLFSFMAWERVKLWSNIQYLKNYWAQNNLSSPRAQVDFATYLLSINKPLEANKLINDTIIRRPDSSLLTVRLIRQKIDTRVIVLSDFKWMQKTIIHQLPEGQAITDLRYLVQQMIADPEMLDKYGDSLIWVLQDMLNDPRSTWQAQDWKGIILYLQGKLYLARKDYSAGYNAFLKSLTMSKNAELGFAMVMEFTQVDQHLLAYDFLHDIKDNIIKYELTHDERLTFMFNDLDAKLRADLGY